MIDLEKLHTEQQEYNAKNFVAMTKSTTEALIFHKTHEKFIRALETIIPPNPEDFFPTEYLEINMVIPEHYEVRLRHVTKPKMAALIEAFEAEFGPAVTDEIVPYGDGFKRTLVAAKIAGSTSFWAPRLEISSFDPKCEIVYREEEVPATTKKVIDRVNCSEEAPNQDLSSLSPPSGDEDQPRAEAGESNDIPF